MLKAVTMAHAWLQTVVFAKMDIAAQVVALVRFFSLGFLCVTLPLSSLIIVIRNIFI